MKTKDLVMVATVALGTATLTVGTFWAGSLDAGNESLPSVPTPKLTSHGVELTLAAPKDHVFKAGEQPTFELTAVNTADRSANVSVCATLNSVSLANLASRMPQLPVALWQQTRSLTLGPRETKTIQITAATNLPPNRLISVSLQATSLVDRSPGLGVFPSPLPQIPGAAAESIVALSFSTVEPSAANARTDPKSAPTLVSIGSR